MTRLDQRVFGMTLLALGSFATLALAQPPASRTPAQSTKPSTPEKSEAKPTEEDCPPFMKGSTLKVTDANGGVAVSITTPVREYVEPLRETLREVAHAVEQQSRMQSVTATTDTPPPLNVSTKDIKNGGQMIIRTDQPADIAELRQQAKGLETAWAESACVSGRTHSAAR